MEVIINITQRDIDKGEKANASACMLHRSISRKIKPVLGMSVYRRVIIETRDENLLCNYELPSNVFELVQDWDSGKLVVPQKVKLDLPEEVLRVRKTR